MGPCCTVCALLALYLLMSFLVHFSKVQVLDAGAASIEMQQRHQNEEMPEDIRGILWMRGNACPELQLTLEAGSYDETTRTVRLPFGTAYSWSYNSDFLGWLEYGAVTVNLAFFSPGQLKVDFDEDFGFGNVQITMAGISIAERLWAMNRTDDEGEFWNRLHWYDSLGWKFQYDLRKVLEADGTKLPAWSEMVNSTITGVVVHGDECGLTTMVKTYQQLLHGDFSTLQIVLSIIFAWLWFSLAVYCFRRNGVMAPSPEFEPLVQA